jgi:Ca2+-transporting ATPase
MAHAQTVAEVLSSLNTDIERGLSNEEAEARRATYGFNELSKPPGKSLFLMIAEQFQDLLVIILMVAAAISFVITVVDNEEGILGYVEPFVIVLILIGNATVGVWQEHSAEAALDALKELQTEHARVLRQREWSTILSRELVPGDIIQVTVGEQVPADCRLAILKTPTIRIAQASLTGENVEVSKTIEPVIKEDIVLQEKTNILFSSSTISSGSAIAIVVGTGQDTEIGKVHEEVMKAKENEEDTPLQKKLDEFGNVLAKVIFVICILVWAMNIGNFFDEVHGSPIRGGIHYFKIAVALAVAAIPEGLPAVITTCLALGTRRMAKRNAIVRRLTSVETLGCTTIICSDKTGTLTTNEMCVTDVFVPTAPQQFSNFPVEGHSFEPKGEIANFTAQHLKEHTRFVNALALCNESKLEYKGGKYVIVGTPTEAALRVLVEKLGQYSTSVPHVAPEEYPMHYSNFIKQSAKFLVNLEFTRERKSMSSLYLHSGEATNTLYVKGAPESIIERSEYLLNPDGSKVSFTREAKEAVARQCEMMSSKALRCLALAYTEDCGPLSDYTGPEHVAHPLLTEYSNFDKFERKLVFLGVVGMRDPPRPEVASSISLCKQAGIKVYMITGDNKQTAEAIGKNIGIFDNDTTCRSFTGAEFEKLAENEAKDILKNSDSCIFSRTEPRHKRRLVEILKSLGEVVAMTGDGVNDAPALQEAQIGIAMGIAGTEVAKQASDMILADDKFSTIVAAVEEGRSIYNNTKAFIRYLISSNIGEVASIFLTAMSGLPEVFTSVQLLWVNLVTDGPPATALGFNPPDLDIMEKPPRRADDALITPWIFFRYMVIGMYVGIATVGIMVYWYTAYNDGHPLVTFHQLSNWSECPGWKDFTLPDFDGLDLSKNPCLFFIEGKAKPSTLSLSVLVTIEMLNALNALSEDSSLLQMPPWANPWLLLAIAGSFSLHCVILYIPVIGQLFGVVPLDCEDWCLVLLFSFPVILIDEALKAVGRARTRRYLRSLKKQN